MQTPAFTTTAPVLLTRPARTVLCQHRPAHARPLSRPAQHAQPQSAHQTRAAAETPGRDVSVILLAGGTGSRMRADRPKQFLQLHGRSVLEHSLALFSSMPEVRQVVLVLAETHRPNVASFVRRCPVPLAFASPGEERQHSVLNALAEVEVDARLVCVHDAARPLVTAEEVRRVLADARRYGAAVLGVPSKATIKESEDGEFVLRTIPRSRLWEIQTPQVVRPELLRRGFERVRVEGLAVTDDVSVVEALGEPVRITMGEYTNIKLTTPEDMNIAESILRERESSEAVR